MRTRVAFVLSSTLTFRPGDPLVLHATPTLGPSVGYLTATASEDWSLVLEVCERASANEASARETVRALRREFKYVRHSYAPSHPLSPPHIRYAEPTAQLAAARVRLFSRSLTFGFLIGDFLLQLWAVLLQNSSSMFMIQCTHRKFLETLEEVVLSPRTSPVVKERLLQVLAAAVYASSASQFFFLRSSFVLTAVLSRAQPARQGSFQITMEKTEIT